MYPCELQQRNQEYEEKRHKRQKQNELTPQLIFEDGTIVTTMEEYNELLSKADTLKLLNFDDIKVNS
jgi:hypothetical protein